MFGIVNIVGNFGTVFCDQAYWQSSVAAKPLQVNFTGCPIIFAKSVFTRDVGHSTVASWNIMLVYTAASEIGTYFSSNWSNNVIECMTQYVSEILLFSRYSFYWFSLISRQYFWNTLRVYFVLRPGCLGLHNRWAYLVCYSVYSR